MGTADSGLILWAAGYFEGEGCIYLEQRAPNGRRYARLIVSSTDLDVLQHFQSVFGCGNIYEHRAEFRKKHKVAKVKGWLADEREVKIFTARVSGPEGPELDEVVAEIERWCEQHIGQVLPITCTKDYGMIELWDDRAVQVVPNTGVTVAEAVVIKIRNALLDLSS